MSAFRFLKYWQFFRDRRIYQSNFSPLIRHKIVFEEKMKSNHEDLKNILFPSSASSECTQRNLESCSKSGTWHYSRVLRRSIWTSRYRAYFPKIESKRQLHDGVCGGIANDIKRFQILEMNEVFYFSNCLKVNGLNMFSFKINKTYRTFKGEKRIGQAISLEIGGADTFQHFSQDCLPLLSYLKVKGILSASIPIILKKPLAKHENIYMILKLFFSEYNFFFVSEGDTLFISKLFVPQFKPRNYVWSLPREMLHSVKTLVANARISAETSNSLIFLERGQNKMRNLQNSDKVMNEFSKLAIDLGLEFDCIDTSNTELSDIALRVAQAKIIVGIHGGSMYNLMFAQARTLVVEIVPREDTNSVLNFTIGLDHYYLPISLAFNIADRNIIITPVELNSVVNEIREGFYRLNTFKDEDSN